MTKIQYDPMTHEPCSSAPHEGQQTMEANGMVFFADKEMIPLLTALNDAGLQTYSHCAGHSPEADRWVVLEADDIQFEVRNHDGRKQLLLRWPVSVEDGRVLTIRDGKI